MNNGICVFAENFGGELAPSVSELLTAAYTLKKITGEKVKALLISDKCEQLEKELTALGAEDIIAFNSEKDMFMQDDVLSKIVSDMISKVSPSTVLVPATTVGRSIFSAVAVKLNCGLTADCTELLAEKSSDGSFYIKQNKPSFGENVMVTIITKPEMPPQIMTVRPGVYLPMEKNYELRSNVIHMDDLEYPKSKIEVLDISKAPAETDNIMAAEVIVAGGRGVLEDNNFELMNKFADSIGAAVGGTRPLADSGKIPFEHQIGQTGCTVRPKILISLGASGAIQHTEGIKDTKLMIAVNKDENAPIFNVADYGLVCDMKDLLENFLK